MDQQREGRTEKAMRAAVSIKPRGQPFQTENICNKLGNNMEENEEKLK